MAVASYYLVLLLHRTARTFPAWVAYALAVAVVFLTLMNMEQARVIAAQRTAVQVFARDSFQYFHLLGTMNSERARAKQARQPHGR